MISNLSAASISTSTSTSNSTSTKLVLVLVLVVDIVLILVLVLVTLMCALENDTTKICTYSKPRLPEPMVKAIQSFGCPAVDTGITQSPEKEPLCRARIVQPFPQR